MLSSEIQRNAEKCREKQRNAEKCIRNSEKCRELLQKCREMKRNVWKCRGMQRNSVKYREMQICRDILMTFMTFMTFMANWNVIFDILEPPAFRKYSTCWILQKFEESCRNFQNNTFFLGKLSQTFEPTHKPRGFVRFGNTKGEFSFVQNL